MTESKRYCGATPPEPISPTSNCTLSKGHHGQHRNMGGDEWDGDFWVDRVSPTEIRINEHGGEYHESWLLVRANRVQCGPPGAFLFDSEIGHASIIRVTVTRCSRNRNLSHDWFCDDGVIIEFDMSEAQWGAFVSSFGNGTGVPATLSYFNDRGLPEGIARNAVHTPRLAESHREVREAGTKALAEIQEAYSLLQQAFDDKAGRKVMGEALRNLQNRMKNAPANMEFAAESLTEHIENVVAKARADIEAMIFMSQSGHDQPHLLDAGESMLEIEDSEHGK